MRSLRQTLVPYSLQVKHKSYGTCTRRFVQIGVCRIYREKSINGKDVKRKEYVSAAKVEAKQRPESFRLADATKFTMIGVEIFPTRRDG